LSRLTGRVFVKNRTLLTATTATLAPFETCAHGAGPAYRGKRNLQWSRDLGRNKALP